MLRPAFLPSLPPSLPRVALSFFGLVAVIAACNGDDDGGVSAQIREFCGGYVSSSAFACCSPDDRRNAVFTARYRFGSQDVCVEALTNQAAQAEGRQGFDAAAAQSCLAYLNGRGCGTLPLANVVAEEQAAGCYRVLAGRQAKDQGCNSSEDCQPGLVCPPVKETGLSFCSEPAATNQSCIGAQARSVDHPACAAGLICSFTGVNPAGCPFPPCEEFTCVPPFEKDFPCSANECGAGLTCVDRICKEGGPGIVGAGCVIADHCAEGLYCDGATGKCAERKADGEACDVANNAIYECKGVCTAGGTCATFCGQ